MQSNYWDDFCKTGKVSDYLKYVDSARNTAENEEKFSNRDDSSHSMESVQDAGKSDGDGAFGHTSW